MLKFLAAVVLFFSMPAFGNVNEAHAAYASGDFAKAATAYESAWKAGALNGHVAYNLGLAYYRLGKPGEAMAAFLAARSLLPRDPDVAANLKVILAQTPDRLETELPKGPAAAATAWLDRLTPREYAWTTALLAGLLGLGLLAAQLVTPLRPALKPLAIALSLPLLTGLALAMRLGRSESWGAVTAATAKVHAAPGAEATLFELRTGAPFVAEEVRAGWMRIVLSDGKKGWIAGTDVKVLR